MGNWVRFSKVYLNLLSRFIWRHRSLAMRGLLAWLLAVVFASFDRDNDLDLRFKIRDRRPVTTPIVILQISQEEAKIFRRLEVHRNLLPTASEAEIYAEFWDKVLAEVLKDRPKAIAVTTASDQVLITGSKNTERWPNLLNPKLTWSVHSDMMEKLIASGSNFQFLSHVGIDNLVTDYDGMLRRYGRSPSGPSLISALSREHLKSDAEELEKLKSKIRYINFRGPKGSIPTISLTDILSHSNRNLIRNKIVLVENKERDEVEFLTPVGPLSRAEVYANILDNSLDNKWVRHISLFTVSLILLAIVVLAGWIMSVYPQAVALFGLIWIATLGSAVAIYTFDSLFLLVPIVPIWIAIFSTYMTFLSLQVTIRDYENQQLEKEREFLLDVEELKNNFLSLISHDLKTPIAKLQGICDRILSQAPPPELSNDVQTLRDEVSELHRYIRTILQVTRVESRDFRIHTESTDINEIVESVCEQLSALAQIKSVQLSLQLEPMFLVEVDPVLIHEVILNLVENAIKYSFNGGRVTIQSREVDDRVMIVVEDAGPGIPETEHARIFERFYRGEEGKRHSKGSGLGLYLVKYFVELHGGQILLDSKPGHGTRIGFSLPVKEKSAEEVLSNNVKTEDTLTEETKIDKDLNYEANT